MIDNRTVGKTIAGLRQAKGMTQQQLAAAMNVSHQAVSKWENGAALPDIQTMVELTQLFGITVEQLISGDVPEARMESAQTPPAPAQSAVGSFVNGVINDIGNLFKSEPQNAPAPEEEEDGAQEAEVKTEKENPEKPENIDLQNLLQMAPFMSKQALEEMLSGQKLSAADIARFAPFVSGECLEKLIADSESEMNWDTLRRVAPFLKKEAVDALVDWYYASTYRVPMGTEEADKAIAGWLNQNTGGLLSEETGNIRTDGNDLLRLYNTIYYKSGWQDAFKSSQTKQDTFTAANGAKQKTDFMHRTESGSYR